MLILFLIIVLLNFSFTNGIEIHFKTNKTDFIDIKSNKVFGYFAGINLGITNPGYLPGHHILNKDDYYHIFNMLDAIGCKVIRIYSLMNPNFYQYLYQWNKNNPNSTFYILHGTAFPEEEFEGTDGFGNNVYDNFITNRMKTYINRTVHGVYGRGNVIYRRIHGTKDVYGYYDTNIAEYLIGWVVGGEIWPFTVNKTNTIMSNMSNIGYQGQFISSINNVSSPFEIWMAMMLDYLAIISYNIGYGAPISHTNWATTDGIYHLSEPRYPDSIEDMVEFDLKHFNHSLWEAGFFYNQHAYPYYPNFISMIENNNTDPYFNYINLLKKHYDDLPLIITEVGLSTSLGIASIDLYKNRNHGHVGEMEQGELLVDIIDNLINKQGIYGVVIFELLDEWFKKTWNTRYFEPEPRHYWYNSLSAEQGFGLARVEPFLKIGQVEGIGDKFIKDVKISNDESNIHIEIEDINLNSGKIVIGIDSVRSGTYQIKNQNINKIFTNQIDHILIIEYNNNNNILVKFLQLGSNNHFIRNYGVWLNSIDNYYLDKHINDIINPSMGLFYPFQQLVRVPSYEYRNESYLREIMYNITIENQTIVYRNLTIDWKLVQYNYSHQRFQLDFLKYQDLELINRENLALYSHKLLPSGNNLFEIKIPYNLIGFTNPSNHQKYILSGQGSDFQINHLIDRQPINFEISYIVGDVELEESLIKLSLDWDNWEIPKSWQVKFKKGFNILRHKFHMINYNITTINNLTTEEIKQLEWNFIRFSKDITILNYDPHKLIVSIVFYFLAFCFFWASIGSLIANSLCYCYWWSNPDTKAKGTSYKLQLINLIALGGLIAIYFNGIRPSKIEFDTLYIIYIIIIIWDAFVIFICLLFVNLDIYKEPSYPPNFTVNQSEHAFIIACHNSSDVIRGTIKSLLEKVPPNSIYVADNGSTENESRKTNLICIEESKEYYKRKKQSFNFDNNQKIHYGYLKTGNKTLAQFASIINLDINVKYVSMIDDDTRLDSSWNLKKVLRYFLDPRVAVLAYPLKVFQPEYEIEYFQNIEYLIVGLVKIFHSKFGGTVFNSGAFGTYRVEILKEAFYNHNTEFHGDDLQICLNIHQLKGKKYITIPDKTHTQNYKVACANDMISPTIVPKCWFHLRSLSQTIFKNSSCDCGNPDLFGQRVKGWFLSKHRFIFRFIKMLFNGIGLKGLWVRLIVLYDLVLIINEYFAIIYGAITIRYFGWWIAEGLMIGIALNIIVMLLFNIMILKKNKLHMPFEIITIQPVIYKLFIIVIYKYLGLFYNLFIYTPLNIKNKKLIRKQITNEDFYNSLKNMYNPIYYKLNNNNDNNIETIVSVPQEDDITNNLNCITDDDEFDQDFKDIISYLNSDKSSYYSGSNSSDSNNTDYTNLSDIISLQNSNSSNDNYNNQLNDLKKIEKIIIKRHKK